MRKNKSKKTQFMLTIGLFVSILQVVFHQGEDKCTLTFKELWTVMSDYRPLKKVLRTIDPADSASQCRQIFHHGHVVHHAHETDDYPVVLRDKPLMTVFSAMFIMGVGFATLTGVLESPDQATRILLSGGVIIGSVGLLAASWRALKIRKS